MPPPHPRDRRADPTGDAHARHPTHHAPGAPMHGPWHGPPWWAHEGPDWRMPRWATLWLPVLISFAFQVPAAILVSRIADLSPRDTALGMVVALVGPVALIAARRFPGPVVAITAVAASLDLFVNVRGGPPYVALGFAILSAVVRDARIWAWVSIGVCWITTITLAAVMGREDWTPFRIAGTTLGILIVFGIGEGIRTRRERAAEWRRRASERRQSAVQAERVRIARELHDVLAHSLSQINVQAGVGLHLMDKQPDKAADALASIKETSKSALDEVRTVLGVLRAEGRPDAPLVPEPDLARLPALVSTASTAQLPVRLDDRLSHADVPAQVQLALYRIVQESLTNAGRHADGASRVDVVLDRVDDVYVLEVRDDGSGRADRAAGESGGRGVLGMRERAELLGGHLSAGPADGRGFVVRAEIPA